MSRRSAALPLLVLATAAICASGCGSSHKSNPVGPGSDGGEPADGAPADGSAGPCQGRRDCPPGLVCDRQVAPSTCVQPPASCADNEQCPAGSLCKIDGSCQPGCNNHGDCLRGWSCKGVTADQFVCQQDCTLPTDCPAGSSCEDHSCVADVQLCAACTGDGDCGSATAKCLPGKDGSFCAKDCSLHGTCPDGFHCETLAAGLKQCVPASGECTTLCPLHPCADGTFCNRASGRCHASLAPCDRCVAQEECGDTARCLTFGERKVCLLPCPNGPADCAKGFRCDPTAETPYCLPLTGTCDRCASTACSALAPYCNAEDGSCLECLSTRHCGPEESCGETSSVCVTVGTACGGPDDQECVAPTPFCFESRCVQCLSSGDCPPPKVGQGPLVCYHFRCLGDDFCQRVTCPTGTNCDREARRCIETGTCRSDPDCPGRRCDTTTGVCFNADGSCVSAGECPTRLDCDVERQVCVGCTVDSDCRPLQKCWPLSGDPAHRRYCHQL